MALRARGGGRRQGRAHPTVANAVLQLNQDASATPLVSTVDMGQDSDTILAQLVAEVLHPEPARVRVVSADTDVTPYDTITAGIRSTYHTGNAVRRAAEAMRERLLEIGAGQLGVGSAALKLTVAGVAGAQRVVSIRTCSTTTSERAAPP